ncbi:hypothetical protein GJAV_G00175740 [Gymnothorax javanicus]|nr:hypothetical protein GJAV_G00175740 [Gymnothorax javanicus]
MKTACDWEAEGCGYSSDVTSWVSACPGGFWNVSRKRTSERGTGDQTPKMGSLCRVRVWGKGEESVQDSGQRWPGPEEDGGLANAYNHASTQDAPLLRSPTTVLQVPLDACIILRLGEGQCDVIEGCIEGMKAGETCELLVSPLDANSRPRPGPGQPSSMCAQDSKGQVKEEENVEQHTRTERLPADPSHFLVELQSFTPGCESWEMSATEKWEWVKEQRERGGHRFREGDLFGAADSYSRALKMLITLKGERISGETDQERDSSEVGREQKKNVPEGGVEMGSGGDGDEIPSQDGYNLVRAGLHSNLGLCQLKLGQPARAQKSCARATELDPSSAKAWYRLGQACFQIGELGMARTAFKKVLELQPGSSSALKALREVGALEKEQDTKLGHRLRQVLKPWSCKATRDCYDDEEHLKFVLLKTLSG